MSRQIIYQIDELTTASTLEQLRATISEAAGLELFFADPLLSSADVDTRVVSALNRLAPARILAAGMTCELGDISVLVATLSHVLQSLAPHGVGSLNLSFVPPRGTALSVGGMEHGGALNVLYGLMRDVRHGVESSGLTLAIEAGRNGYILSPRELSDLVDGVNSWAFGACVDMAVISRFSRPVDWIGTLGRRLSSIRLHGECLSNAVDVDTLAAALAAVQFGGPIIVCGAAANEAQFLTRLRRAAAR